MSARRAFAIALLALLRALVTLPAAATEATAQVPVETLVLDNGMELLLVPRPELTTVSAGWVAHVGSANERPGITGMAHLFEHMMFKGSHVIGTTDIAADLAVIAEQEALQEQIRAVYREQRARWRRGEIADPYDSEGRPPELVELQRRFDELVERQRALMKKDEFDQVYTENGASFLNAFTNADMTVYLITVPANKLELGFWMESDRLQQPVFREFYSERDVVYEERRLRTESTPTGRFDELFNSMFWQAHPYGWPTVGWPSDLRVISKAQADEFFATYYAPNNVTAVLVGNFDPARVKELAERYFGRIPRGEREPPDVVTLELPQVAEKRMVAECDCQPQIQVRYHTVPFDHADSYPLEVLAGLLNGRTGRLYKAMIEGEEIASAASAGPSADKHAGSFTFEAETKGESTPAMLEASWDRAIQRLRDEPVGAEELTKVKNVIAADNYRRLQNPFFLMVQLAVYQGLGDWRVLNQEGAKLAAVTAEDVQRVAREYFARENRLVGHYTRKAGTAAEEVPPELADLPAEMRQGVTAQLRQIRAMDDLEALRQILAQAEGQAAQAPPEMQPVIELVLRALVERIAELSEGGEP
ncbi:MAG TPA: pitrilysin family protein [Thermoanaerobaculia bacterium]|nr:pitrilysin family protein [Thermoanaerobaculia bacterium]